MTTTELHRQVARRTGETPSTIADRGFQFVSADWSSRCDACDPEDRTIDWDALPARHEDLFPRRDG